MTPASVAVTDAFGNTRVCPDDGSDPSCTEAIPGEDADAEVPDASAAESLMASGCRSPRRRPGRVYSALAGNRLFGFFLDSYWCWDGGFITYKSSYRAHAYPEIYFLVWKYDGVLTSAGYTTWGPNDTSVTSARVGKFRLCIAFKGVGCVQHKNPRLKIHITGRGYVWSGGG